VAGRQRIDRVRRQYNQWVANQTLEDYALRFTAKSARRWSAARVANTALGAISFLALEAIGGTITLNYGVTNATAAILVVSAIIFFCGLPIAYHAAKCGIDIDLLTRGAGFGYIGSTVTSLIYASFTFIFFAIEAVILASALEMCLGIPRPIGYLISAVVIIPLVTYGITLISRFQLWTQPLWIVLHALPFAAIAYANPHSFSEWARFAGEHGSAGQLDLLLFGTASSVVFSLVAQIGEQVDFLRFLPRDRRTSKTSWWIALLTAGPGWIVLGALKLLAGSFLAFFAINHGVSYEHAAEPAQMYLQAFRYVLAQPDLALALTGTFVILSQVKINVTNAYAGSIAWSNFFSRLTHSHPGRVVWLVFNVLVALLLMEIGVYKALEQTLALYSNVAIAWVGALVSDLIVNKPLGLRPRQMEFKRAHLYDINPVGVGAMLTATIAGIAAFSGILGTTLQSLSSFLALLVAFVMAPFIAWATQGRFYVARTPRQSWNSQDVIRCSICEHHFEAEDMAHCPAYSGAICSLCCSLETRCRDCCKPQGRISNQLFAWFGEALPERAVRLLNTHVGRYLGVLLLFIGVIGAVLSLVYFLISLDMDGPRDLLASTLWTVFIILIIIAGVAAWLFVLAQESRRVAEEETRRQTDLLMNEIEAHKRTDAKLQKAKEVAEAASKAKSRHVVALSHELRTPLNAILGYAQLLERDPAIPQPRINAIKVVRRSAEHLSGLIDGLLDISKIEAGRFHLSRNEVQLSDFLDDLVAMFRLQATAKGIEFHVQIGRLPAAVQTDENRLRQILINLLSNAIKFTDTGHVTFEVRYHHQVAAFTVEDTGVGIHKSDLERIFQPFERARTVGAKATIGTGLGLTITSLLTKIMGGDITVRSEVGKGSTFRVKLFLSEVSRPRIASTMEYRVRGYAGPRQTILVVDDNEVQRELIRDLLAPLGFLVVSAGTGRECLQVVEETNPNLILLDIAMPEMDGWEVAQRLRRQPGKRAAILMLSANAIDPHHMLEAERLYDDTLMKPIDLRQLLKKIHALVDIAWLYETEAEAAPPVLPRVAFALPPSRDIDELIRLGEIGHVSRILEKLSEIESGAPECCEFITRMRVMVNAFDFTRYASALQEVRGAHA
jgi:signal transduction histidine kinase/CheY-like chemotaxis protein/purine-cytosine permease-like protein